MWCYICKSFGIVCMNTKQTRQFCCHLKRDIGIRYWAGVDNHIGITDLRTAVFIHDVNQLVNSYLLILLCKSLYMKRYQEGHWQFVSRKHKALVLDCMINSLCLRYNEFSMCLYTIFLFGKRWWFFKTTLCVLVMI